MRRRTRDMIALTLMLAGAVCIAIGAARGEALMVFTKAVNLCLECIGIG